MAAGAAVTDHDFGDDRDPLLVRPFLLNDSGAHGDDPSTQTWPAATTREVRSHHASADDPTGPLPPAARRRYRRRLIVIGVVGVAVILAAAVAGFAALRPAMRPSVSAALPGSPLPIVTGPTSAGSAPAATSATSRRAQHSASATAIAPTVGPATQASAGGATPATTDGQTATVPTAPTQQLAPVLARTGTIRGEKGLCLDLSGGIPADDSQVQVSTCKGSGTQLWTLATDGTLQVTGKCALAVGDDTVHIVGCDGRTTAQWRVTGSTLINASNSKCLTDPASGNTPGTAVTLTRCTNAKNQLWSLP